MTALDDRLAKTRAWRKWDRERRHRLEREAAEKAAEERRADDLEQLERTGRAAP